MEANDADAMCPLACYYHKGGGCLLQDRTKVIELWTQAAKLGSSDAHYQLGSVLMKQEIQRKRSFTSRQRLWQGMKYPNIVLVDLRMSPAIWIELLSIG